MALGKLNKWTRANRETLVVGFEVFELPPGHLLRPKLEALDRVTDTLLYRAILEDRTIWQSRTLYKSGLYEMQSSFGLHATYESVEAFKSRHPIGSSFDPLDFLDPNNKEFDPDNLSSLTLISIFGRGDAPYSLIYDVLHGAGIYENYRPSRDLLKWVGDKGCEALERQFGENWECVAIMDYCVKHFAPTSLASLAARVMVADFVSNDQFDMGYSSRELEVLASGIEEVASKAMTAQKKRGQMGGLASASRRLKNLNALMDAIERLAPAVALFSEDRIVQQAFEGAASKVRTMPKSKLTQDEYMTTIRSEEPFKSRYQAVFSQNA